MTIPDSKSARRAEAFPSQHASYLLGQAAHLHPRHEVPVGGVNRSPVENVSQPPFQDVALADVDPAVENGLDGLRSEPATPPVVLQVRFEPVEFLSERAIDRSGERDGARREERQIGWDGRRRRQQPGEGRERKKDGAAVSSLCSNRGGTEGGRQQQDRRQPGREKRMTKH